MKNSTWALCAAAILAGDMALQLITMQPIADRIDALTAQISSLQTGIEQLTASTGPTTRTNSLLANLQAQGERARTAQAAIEQMSRLEQEVRSQGQAAGQSLNLLRNIGRLNNEVLAQGRQITALGDALENLSAFQQQVHGLASAATREHAGVDRAEQVVRELGQLKQEITAQADGLEAATGSIEELAALKQRVTFEANGLDDAHSSLNQLGALKRQVSVEGAEVAGAFESLQQLANLKQSVSSEAIGVEQANESLRQLGDLKERVASEAAGLEVAQSQFAQLIDLKNAAGAIDAEQIVAALSRVAELANLKNLIIEGGQDVASAIELSGQMLGMQDELINRAERIDVARKHADGLLGLEVILADDAALNINHAQDNLEAMVALQQRLSSQDEQIIAAVESLELMLDLQVELAERIGDLESLRSGLTEIAMLESSIVRTVKSLEPLVELTQLRRLNGDDLQTIARKMLQRDNARIATIEGQDAASNVESTGDVLVPLPPTIE